MLQKLCTRVEDNNNEDIKNLTKIFGKKKTMVSNVGGVKIKI